MEVFDVLAHWLSAHQFWLLVTIGVVAFAESLAVVGLLLPGVVMLFSAATLAGSGAVGIWGLLAAGFIGAFLGDGLSFFLGYIFRHRIRNWWPFYARPHWLERGELFFGRHGGVSIALGRFIGPVRPVIPLVAGMMAMPTGYFIAVNLISSLAWAPVYLLPGYLVGNSLHWREQVPVEWLTILVMAFFLAVCSAYMCQYLLSKLPADRLCKTGLRVSVIFLLAVCVLTVLPVGIEFNNLVMTATYPLQMPLMTKIFRGITYFGETYAVIGGGLLALVFLSLDALSLKTRASWVNCCVLLAATLGVRVAFEGLKALYATPRPYPAISTSYAFPSGHTACSTFTWLMLAWYLGRYLPDRYKPWLWSVGLFISFAVGASRVYLAEHWTLDVFGGLGIALGLMFAWLFWESRHPCPIPQNSLPVRLIASAALAVALLYPWI